MRDWVVLGLLLSGPAFAQEVSRDAPPPVGIPHTCDKYYPKDLQRKGIEGTTTLAFLITKGGRVKQIAIKELAEIMNSTLRLVFVRCIGAINRR